MVPSTDFGAPCPAGNTEEKGAKAEPADSDEDATAADGPACVPASRSTLVRISACTNQNNGFDVTNRSIVQAP